MQLEGAGAIVTGGASGLGAATVRRLAAGGARVVIVDRDDAKGGALAAELSGAHGGAVAYANTDVTDEEQVAGAIEMAAELAPLRIVVNCAGIAVAARALNKDGSPHPLDRFRKVIEVNLIGTFNVTRLAAAVMVGNEPDAGGERGAIVNTASVAAFEGQIGQAAYSASKGGVAALTLPLAREYARFGIRVLTIAPGTFDTPLFDGLPDAAKAALAADVPFPNRLGQPTEFALLVSQLLENPYLNGETVRLDGALRMPPK